LTGDLVGLSVISLTGDLVGLSVISLTGDLVGLEVISYSHVWPPGSDGFSTHVRPSQQGTKLSQFAPSGRQMGPGLG